MGIFLLKFNNFFRSLGLVARLILFVCCLVILAVSSYLAIKLINYFSSNLHPVCSYRLLTHPISRKPESVAIVAAVQPDAAKPQSDST